MEEPNNIYDEFAERYIDNFMENVTLGVEGGIYKEVIAIPPGKEGIFTSKDITKFIRFNHGDRGYHYNFGKVDDKKLQSNPIEIAKSFLKVIDTNWHSKKYYITVAPNLIKNAKNSLIEIIAKVKMDESSLGKKDIS